MTDRGTRVRWSTAALVAPAAAAIFTGTTVWASGHEPATASTPTVSSPKVAAAVPAAKADPVVVALQAAIDKNTAQVAKLRSTVAALQARAAAIAKGSTVPRAASSRSTTSTSATRASSTRSSTPTTTRTTATRTTTAAPAPAPAPAPPTQTTTGASGAVK